MGVFIWSNISPLRGHQAYNGIEVIEGDANVVLACLSFSVVNEKIDIRGDHVLGNRADRAAVISALKCFRNCVIKGYYL